MASSRVPGSSPTSRRESRDSGSGLGTSRSRSQLRSPPPAPPAVASPSPVRHNLPHIPTMLPNASRVAVSKTSARDERQQAANLANMPPAAAASPLASLESMVESKVPKKENYEANPPGGDTKLPSGLPTPPSEGSPKSAGAGSSSNQSPPGGIKLRIRRSIHEDGTSQRTSILNPQEPPPASSQHLAAPVSLMPHSPAAPSTGVERPKHGRTKTKGDIKKQLMEKKGKKRLEGQAQSPASTSQSESQETPPPPPPAVPEKVPLPVAPSKGKPAEMKPEDLENPPKWLVGDLMWSKVSSHPWWPSMVSFDPFIGVYTRLNSRGKGEKKLFKREYHVQFFGNEGERGWIPENRMLQFEGEEAFQSYAKEKIAENRKNRIMYEVAPRRRKAWMVAVRGASEALPMTRNERKVNFTFTYNIPSLQPKQSASHEEHELGSYLTTADGMEVLPNGVVRKKRGRPPKRKVSETETSPGEATQPQKRRRKDTADIGASPLANKSVAQFMVFCQKRRESIRKESPDLDDEQVDVKLKEQWGQLDEEQKSKFIPMGVDVQHISEMIPAQASRVQRSGRVVKLSQKMMDADEESELFQTPTPKKRRRPSSSQRASMSPRPLHQTAASSSTSIDDIISSVAAGAGQVKDILVAAQHNLGLGDPAAEKKLIKKKEPEAMDVTPELPAGTPETSGQPKKRTKKKKSDQGASSDDASSTTGSIPSMDLAEVAKKPVAPRLKADPNELDLEVFRLSSHCSTKKETVCRICEQPGELLNCEGMCMGSYHLSCLGLPVLPSGTFRCDECVSGNHTCFICKKSGTDTKRCSSRDCGRFYHEDCIRRFPGATRFEGNHFHCPLHVCATCMANNPKNVKASKGRLFRCVRCPSAYHVGDLCVAAGSLHLAGFNIVCSRHFQPVKTVSHHSNFSVSWCFICSKGGTLLCCELCPAAFHTECLEIQPPEGAFYCRDCQSGKRPLYSNIIWVKLGSYRWWPGEICHPRNVPLNIQEKSHQVGEFPIHFFGSHDYFWTHQGRVFMFQEGDKGSKDATSKGLAKIFSRGVEEATKAFRYWKEAQARKEEQEQEKTEKKPLPYKHIKTNLAIGSVQIYKADLNEIARCECRPEMEAPCGPESECWNRMLMYECHPTVCPAGDKCCNQRFQRREYPKAEPAKTEGRGWGLKALEDIRKGQFVNEYVGDLVDETECRRRMKQLHEDDMSNFYMLTLDKNRIIDAGPKGNFSRFMNHSCDPNCETQKWNVNGDVRVGLFALHDVTAGEELTFNYNLDCLGNDKKVCHCGAANCSGFLGVRPKTNNGVEKENKPKKKKHKKHDPRRPRKVHEDDCYRCGDGGELVMCDRSHCPKVYHLKCLKLSKAPVGSWICPWHHCDICGKKALKLCSECPNSFCHEHIEGNIFLIPENKLVCHEHQDILSAIESSRMESLKNEAEGEACKSGMSSSSSSDITMSSSDSSPAHSDSESDTPVLDSTPPDDKTAAKPLQPLNGKEVTESGSKASPAPKRVRSKGDRKSQSKRRKSKSGDSSSSQSTDTESEKPIPRRKSTNSATNSGAAAAAVPPSEPDSSGAKSKVTRKSSSGGQDGPGQTEDKNTVKNGDSKAAGILSPKAADKDSKLAASPTKKRSRKSSGGGKTSADVSTKSADSVPALKSPGSEPKRRSVSTSRKGDRQQPSDSKSEKSATPKTNGRRQSPKGRMRSNNNQGEQKKKDSPMFDDDDSDEFPDLVIDIPNL